MDWRGWELPLGLAGCLGVVVVGTGFIDAIVARDVDLVGRNGSDGG